MQFYPYSTNKKLHIQCIHPPIQVVRDDIINEYLPLREGRTPNFRVVMVVMVMVMVVIVGEGIGMVVEV